MEPLDYPFAPVTLDAPAVALVRETLVASERDHGLYADRPALLELCLVYLKHCSPAGASDEALKGMSQLLYVIMYFADRVRASALTPEAEAAFALVAGAAPVAAPPQPEPAPRVRSAAFEAGERLRAALARHGGTATTFAHRFRLNLSAFLWDAAHGGEPRALEDQLELRVQTICVMGYLRAFALFDGLLRPADELAFGFAVERLERLSAEICALANDLRSVDRDEREGAFNCVLLEEATRTCDRATAIAVIRKRHDETVHRMEHGLRRLARQPGAPTRYLELIGSCTRGNNTSMDELSRRYR